MNDGIRPSVLRTVVAFAVAPLAAPAILWSYYVIMDLLFGPREALTDYLVFLGVTVAFGAPASYVATAVVAVPAFLAVRHRVRAWHMIAAGIAAALAIAPFVLDPQLVRTPVPAIMGAGAATVWWLIFNRKG